MKIILTFLLCALVAFIVGCMVLLAILKIRKGWLIFWFLQMLIVIILLIFGSAFIEGAFDVDSLRDRIEPYSILLFVILGQFVLTALLHVRFLAAFLSLVKSRGNRRNMREKAENLFIEFAW